MAPVAIALPSLGTMLVLAGVVIGQDATTGSGVAEGAEGAEGARAVQARIRDSLAQLGQPRRWRRAATRLERMGEPAVEPMVEAIEKTDFEVSDLTFRVLGVLEAMGPAGQSAYGPLADAIGKSDPKVFLALWHTLGTLIPYTESRANRNEAQRLIQGAIQTLTVLNPADRRTWSAGYSRFTQRAAVDPDLGLEAMIDEVKRNVLHRREVAAEVLQRMGKAAVSAIPVLADGLRAAIRKQRRARRVRVAKAKAKAKANTKVVRIQQRDTFAARAAAAMIEIAPGDPRCAVAYGWQVRESPSPDDRARAALQIGSFGAASKAELPTLIAALGDRDKRVRWEVITAIGMLGSAAAAAVPELSKIAAAADKAAAARAKAALEQIHRK